MSFFTGRGFAELQILKKWKLNWVEYCDEILHTHSYWHDVAHETVKWHLALVEVLPSFKFWKQWNLTLKPFGIFWKNFADTLILTRSSSRNCKMTSIIGRSVAKRQILKKRKWLYLLKRVEYFDKLLRKHWYWQDLAREIAKWHFSLVEALPSSKFWKNDTAAISWTEWNIVMKFFIHIDTGSKLSNWPPRRSMENNLIYIRRSIWTFPVASFRGVQQGHR